VKQPFFELKTLLLRRGKSSNSGVGLGAKNSDNAAVHAAKEGVLIFCLMFTG